VGFSTGGDLALYQAALKNEHFKCVVSINAPLYLRNIASNFASTVVFWNKFLNKLHIQKGRFEFVENRPENPHINYFKNPIAGVKELERFMDVVRKNLKHVSIPALIIQGSHDPVVNPESADEIFEKIGSKRKELIKVHASRHGIVNGDGAQNVFRRVAQFLDENFQDGL
jgi:esterase/lipase